jgi:Protein of unknown function (DUF4446)
VADLDSTAGIVALAAGAVAVAALLIALTLAVQLRRVRAAQRAVIGEGPGRDLTAHAHDLERGLSALREHVDAVGGRLDGRADEADARLEGAITHAAVVRYDAYDEMTGRQSSSIALLDDRRNGLVLSSILHREQARMYAKPVVGGQSEIGLSPEEEAAVTQALSGGASPSA